MSFSHLRLFLSRIPSQLPSRYKPIKMLGEGQFGKVVKCRVAHTNKTVAIKIPTTYDIDTRNEVRLLKKMMRHKFDQQNIVKFLDSFHTKFGEAMVFEELDISFSRYMLETKSAPMRLSDIRTIIQQLATAFNALKSIGVIHTDVKLDNMMMENHRIRPFKVKLIDFGLAIPKSEAMEGTTIQPLWYRSPEVILGLPFGEAVDMWSLGITMAKLVCGSFLFPGNSEYDVMQFIVELLGQPEHHLLCRGGKTQQFFTRKGSKKWRLKSNGDHYVNPITPCYKEYDFESLDDLKQLRLEKENNAEAIEREQCIELLKAMLTIDPNKRITPKEVLAHPFITQEYPKNDALASGPAKCITKTDETSFEINRGPRTAVVHPENKDVASSQSVRSCTVQTPKGASLPCVTEDLECEPQATPQEDKDSITIQPDNCNPAGVMVKPAAAQDTLQLEDGRTVVSDQPGLNGTPETSDLRSSTEASESQDSTTSDDKGEEMNQSNLLHSITSWIRTFWPL